MVVVEFVGKAGGEFKRFAIILFKVVLDVINDKGFETKFLKVEFVLEPWKVAELDDEEEEEFVLALLIEELCLFNTFCKLFVEKTSCNKEGVEGKEKDVEELEEELEDEEDNCWLREE